MNFDPFVGTIFYLIPQLHLLLIVSLNTKVYLSIVYR